MPNNPLAVLLAASMTAMLSGCGASSMSESSGAPATPAVTGTATTSSTKPGAVDLGGALPAGTANSVVATVGVGGTVSAVVGGSRPVSVTFASSDGLPITGFALSGTTLPPGWSGPSGFECASVSTGSGCVLRLNFSPTVAGAGTVTLNYVFIDNAKMPRAPGGSLTIPYAATADDNVVAVVSAAGQVTALAGAGSRSLNIGFVTDDGYAATNLLVTSDLSALPAGWTTSSGSFGCAIVSTGNGCRLGLTFAPTAAGSGTLTLGYRFTSAAGTTKTGVVNVPYAATTNDTVIATSTPGAQITAVMKGGARVVLVAFTTDDGATVNGLSVSSDLTALPAGWSAPSGGFSCKTVGTGSGCELPLQYAPSGLGAGLLSLAYTFNDSAGTARAGTMDLAYAATTNDNVVTVASPSGPVNTVVGQGTEDVIVAFTTDDGRDATNLQVTSDLAALPAGWATGDTGFGCFGLGRQFVCQMTLSYTPAAAASGTLPLNYAYMNDAGEYKTGTLDLAYRATTHDNVVGLATPATLSVAPGASAALAVAFSTDDGNPATNLAITGGLASLPAGWSTASAPFTCPTVSAGAACALSLTYAPTAPATGSLTLTYAYVDDAGAAKTGTVNVPYVAR